MSEQVRRAARLNLVEQALREHANGLTARELATRLGISQRTAQRDIRVLESEAGVPIEEMPGRRYRVMPGTAPVGAIRFTLQEARAVYLAQRLFLRLSDELDIDAIAALSKLAGALPPNLAIQAEAAGHEHINRRKPKRRHVEVLRELTTAWAESQTVTIRYRSQPSQSEKTTQLDPYLLEPSSTGAAVYVIGWSHAHSQVRTFKVDRIVHAGRTGASFKPSGVDEIRRRLSRSWGGVVLADDQYEVVLEFSHLVAAHVAETTWHTSQRLTQLPDGGLRLELVLPSLLEFTPWVRSWGAAVHVIGPEALRAEVARTLHAAAAQYADLLPG